MFGFMIAGNKSGIVIIQSIFSVITVNALFYLAQLKFRNNRFSIIAVIISIVLYKRNYIDGNSVEEYCLPFLVVSLFFQMKFLYERLQQHCYFFKFYFPYWCIVFAAILAFWRKAYYIALFYTLTFALETYLFLSGQLFLQYPAICTPQVALLLNVLFPINIKKSVKGIITVIAFPVIMIICAYSIKNMTASFKIYHMYHDLKHARDSYVSLLSQIPNDELYYFIAYDDNRFKELYLAYDMTPTYKYFVIQEWHASFSEFVKSDIHSVFKNGHAKWILTAGETNNISDVLQERYEVYDSVDDYVLYKMR